MALSRETLISMVKNEYPSSYSSDVEKMSHEDLMGLLDYLDSIKGKADGGAIGIEVLFKKKNGGRVGLQTGGTPYDPRASVQDYANALKSVSAGTTYQQQADAKRYATQEANRMLTDAFRSGNINQLANQFNFQNDPSLRFEKNRSGIYGLTQANRENVLKNMANQMLSTTSYAPPPPPTDSLTGMLESQMLPNMADGSMRSLAEQNAIRDKVLAAQKAQEESYFMTDPITGKKYASEDEAIEDLGIVTYNERFADGGRVGFSNGGSGNWWDGLEGEAKGIYDSMTAYGASDAEIQSKLQAQNLWSPDGTPDSGNTGQVTGIINQNIGGDGPYAGQVVDQTDYGFNKKNYQPGGKLEINPEALGINFYESGPGKVKDQLPQSFVEANKHLSPNQQKNKYYTGKEVGVDYGALEAKEPGFIESFMSAAVPNKMKSTVTMPGYEIGQSVNPSEFANFMDANIEGIPGNLTRQDLVNMYDKYNKFFGRSSNYLDARVPGTASNLIGMIPKVGWLKKGAEALFGPPGDKSMQSKYSVDNAGYGQGTSRDEFGTYTGGKTLMGKTNDYVERMQNDITFLENDFFGDIMGDTDFEDLTESQITAMQKKNGFNFKKLQAYKNRLATEKINTDFAKKQAEIEAKKEAEKLAAEGKIRLGSNLIQDTNYKSDPALSKEGREKYTGKGMAFEKKQSGTFTTPSGKKGYRGGRKDGGLISYNRGGLASMFTRRR